MQIFLVGALALSGSDDVKCEYDNVILHTIHRLTNEWRFAQLIEFLYAVTGLMNVLLALCVYESCTFTLLYQYRRYQ